MLARLAILTTPPAIVATIILVALLAYSVYALVVFLFSIGGNH